MPLIAYKLILISLDRQRLREIAQVLEDSGHTDDAEFLRNLVNLAEEI
jgi:hypothetical protein